MSVISVDLVYTLPPPYGGVSTHVKRLHGRLSQAGIDSRCYRDPLWRNGAGSSDSSVPMLPRQFWKIPEGWSWLVPYGLMHPKPLVHCHYGFYWSGAMLALRLLKRPVVMTIHDNMSTKKLARMAATERWAARRLVKDPGVAWIAVSPGVRSELWSLGVAPNKVVVIPAYLRPRLDEKPPPFSPALESFLSRHRPILSAYGGRLAADSDGVDLYGFDSCCKALSALSQHYTNMGLVLLIPQRGTDAHEERLSAIIRALGIADSLFLLRDDLPEAWPLWMRSDVHLRPSTTDGDSVAIREALTVGTPVAASDAAERPNGVFLHRRGDLDSLVGAIRRCLAAGRQAPDRQQPQHDAVERILDVYRSVQRPARHGAAADLGQR